jgi:hypothetical protein
LILIGLLPLPAPAQVDDLLTPLTPSSQKGKKAQRGKKRQRGNEERQRREEVDDEIVSPAKGKGRVLIRGSELPSRAVALVDGREIKPGTRLELDAGRHTVVVRRPGYREFSTQVTVIADRTLELSPTLEPLAGVVAVLGDVPGNLVLVDGQRIGETPVQELTLPPGEHEVIVRRDGFEDYVSRLSIIAGRDYTISGNLKLKDSRTIAAVDDDRARLVPERSLDRRAPFDSSREREVTASAPWYGQWYVWAGVGALVAAGVTSAIVVTQNGNPLDPDRDVCGGACAGTINAPGARIGF